jgi:hypothetical protein
LEGEGRRIGRREKSRRKEEKIIEVMSEGGGYFFEYFHQFLSLGEIKNSGETLVLIGTYWIQIGQLSANVGQIPIIEFSKIWLFSIFWEIFELFEFNMRFCSKIG